MIAAEIVFAVLAAGYLGAMVYGLVVWNRAVALERRQIELDAVMLPARTFLDPPATAEEAEEIARQRLLELRVEQRTAWAVEHPRSGVPFLRHGAPPLADDEGGRRGD